MGGSQAFRDHNEPLVLEYGRRRFDGGSEIQMIAQIERQLAYREQEAIVRQRFGATVPMMAQPNVSRLAPAAPEPCEMVENEAVAQMSVWETACSAVIQMMLGISGLVVGQLMTFSVVKDQVPGYEALASERDVLMSQSHDVIKTSIKRLAGLPAQALQMIF